MTSGTKVKFKERNNNLILRNDVVTSNGFITNHLSLFKTMTRIFSLRRSSYPQKLAPVLRELCPISVLCVDLRIGTYG